LANIKPCRILLWKTPPKEAAVDKLLLPPRCRQTLLKKAGTLSEVGGGPALPVLYSAQQHITDGAFVSARALHHFSCCC
jgi:hypothetical protein